MSEAARNLDTRDEQRPGSQTMDYESVGRGEHEERGARVARPAVYDEYWRPAVEDPSRTLDLHSETCENCGTEFALGGRFCHVCGAERDAEFRARGSNWSFGNVLDLDVIKAALGLPLASVVFFVIGITCTVAAAVVGFVFTATTLLDWQAVQIWRMEWLLAAVAAFAAGILLKK